MYRWCVCASVERIFQASNFLPTLFPPEVLFVVDHALDHGAHGDTADQLVSQWWKLGAEVHLHVQNRRGGHDHILGLESERVDGVKRIPQTCPHTTRWQQRTRQIHSPVSV